MHRIDLPAWAVERGAALNAFATFDRPGAALVNIDMQNAFMAEGEVFANAHARDIVGAVNAISRAMRAVGGPVIWTRQTHTFEGPCAAPAWQYDLSRREIAAGVAALQSNAPGHALYAAMDVAPGDIIVDKYRYGALSCPAGALGRTLGSLGATMVLITGTLTNCCCETTAREAYMAGYKVIVVADATAAVTDAEHNAALLNLRLTFADVLTAQEAIARIRS